MSKYEAGKLFMDCYGRKYKIVEAVERTDKNGKPYTLYNLYPINSKPVPVKNEWEKKRGLKYEPYLDTIDEGMDLIFIRYIS